MSEPIIETSLLPTAPKIDPKTVRTYIGIFGVLLGAILATLGTRVTTFGLADLRGGMHASFDEGAWITTCFGVGQMSVGVACPYLGTIFGVRRVILSGCVLLFVESLLAPFSSNLPAYFVAQFLAGVGSGTFIPLTLGFVVGSLPRRLAVYGIAIYAMNSELSQNVAASLEGWYSEHWSWQWIHWQYCVLVLPMFASIRIGLPDEPVNLDRLAELDWPGLLYSAIGFSLLYAGLDQGNRLDWTGNGLVVALLAAGLILTAVFVIREGFAAKPFFNVRVLSHGLLLLLLLLLAGFRFIVLSTAYIIPAYLQVVQNFRELQVGDVLIWIALPQLLLVLPLGYLLDRHDGRWMLAIGTALIGLACLQATQLTASWATGEFLPSQLLQAVGQSLGLTAIVVLTMRAIDPADVLAVGALLQVSRLLGGEIGVAFMQTFVRKREQLHSNLIGLHINGDSPMTAGRLAQLRSAVAAHGTDLAQASERAMSTLSAAVAKQAAVLSYIDGFLAAATGALLCLVVVALLPAEISKPQR